MVKQLQEYEEANSLIRSLTDTWLENFEVGVCEHADQYLKDWTWNNQRQIDVVIDQYPDAILYYKFEGIGYEQEGALYACFFKVI